MDHKTSTNLMKEKFLGIRLDVIFYVLCAFYEQQGIVLEELL